MTPAQALRETLRADLKTAMLGKDRERAALIRTLIAAIDNAEAVEASPGQLREGFRQLGDPSGEVARRVLSEADIAAVLETEVNSRLAAAAQIRAAGNEAEAGLLEIEAKAVAGYRL
jgi:uncharacterized protein YqeY